MSRSGDCRWRFCDGGFASWLLLSAGLYQLSLKNLHTVPSHWLRSKCQSTPHLGGASLILTCMKGLEYGGHVPGRLLDYVNEDFTFPTVNLKYDSKPTLICIHIVDYDSIDL